MKSLASISRFLLLASLMIPLGGASGCGFKNAVLFPDKSPKPAIRDRYVVLLLVDGALPGEVDRLVEAGRLPRFKELFYDGGARFENAVSVIPTVSTPAHQAFVSGLFPGHHGIPNLDWFSRPLKKYIDYLKPKDISLTNTFMFNFKQVQEGSIRGDEPQLIYHYLNGYPTMTVFEPSNSGATSVLPKHPPLLTAFHGKMEKFYETFDLRAMRLALQAFRELPQDQLPRFSYVSFYGMDLVGHFAGPQSPRAEDLYLQHDRFLGELRQTLKDRGLWEKTTLILVSDHGQHALSKTTDLPALLSAIGLRIDKSRPDAMQVIWGDHGTGFTNLYFKMGKDWSQSPTLEELRSYPLDESSHVDLIAACGAHPDIDFVVVPENAQRVRLFRKGLEATVERRKSTKGMEYAYRPSQAEDPLGYAQDPVLSQWLRDGEFHDAESWLKQTHAKEFPDAVVLLSQIFDDYRVGDMLLFTVRESQFKESRLSGHGSMVAEDLKILMMLHGPDIKTGKYPFARSVDLFPVLLRLFGLAPRQVHDGTARNDIFKEGVPKTLDSVSLNPGMKAEPFRKRIAEKMEETKLSEVERERSVQLLYSLDRYLKNEASQFGSVTAPATQKP